MRIIKSVFLLIGLFVLFSCNTENHEGVAIYPFANEIRPQQLSTTSHLELAKIPFLTENDIISYDKITLDIELTKEGAEKLNKMKVPVSGVAFAVCVNHEPIYTGAFWRDYSSISFDGVIIDTTMVSQENPIIRPELGYPNSSFFHGEDPRASPRIMEELEKAGKLK
jgi:hypothetical protein